MSQNVMKNLKYQLLKSRGFASRVLHDVMSSDVNLSEDEDRVKVLFRQYTQEMADKIRENIQEYPEEIIQQLTEEGFFLEKQRNVENQSEIENR